jgi:hypothetical protein
MRITWKRNHCKYVFKKLNIKIEQRAREPPINKVMMSKVNNLLGGICHGNY